MKMETTLLILFIALFVSFEINGDSSSEEKYSKRHRFPWWLLNRRFGRGGGDFDFDVELDFDFDFGGGGFIGEGLFFGGQCITNAGCRLQCSGVLKDNAGICIRQRCICFRTPDICV